MKKITRISDLEKKYVLDVLNNEFKSDKNYTYVTKLEKLFAKKCNCDYAIAMNNGTSTLHIALEAAGVNEGDEVIVPALTMSSTNLCVLHANAIPIFADIDEKTFNISIDSIKKNITKRTKAIIAVSLYGLPTDIDAIMDIAEKNNIIVIEDNAECLFGKYKNKIVGQTAHMTSFSFQASKHITSGEGGIVTTNDSDLALKLRRYSGLGYGSIGLEKGRISKNDIQSPNFDRHVVLGWNCRPSDLCGAVALAQLERADELIEMRVIAAKHYLNAIKDYEWLVPQYVPNGYINTYWSFSVLLDINKVDWERFRNKFIEFGGNGIYGAWKLGYLEPVYQNMNFLGREKYIKKYGNYLYNRGLCPIAENVQKRMLQFKTDYWDENDAIKQAEILRKTCEFFN